MTGSEVNVSARFDFFRSLSLVCLRIFVHFLEGVNMKRALLLTVCLMFAAGMAFAQAGNIGVFADTGGLSCDLSNAAGFMQVQVVHVNSPGATACQFMLTLMGAPLTWVGDASPFTSVIGNTQVGIAVAYGACLVSPIHVVTATYMGISPACDMLRVVADPTATPPGIYVTDCVLPTPNLLPIALGGAGYINNDGSCPCDVPDSCRYGDLYGYIAGL
jgi:hypothetical protein